MTGEPLLSLSSSYSFNTEHVLRFCLHISKSIQQLRQTHARILRTFQPHYLLLFLTTQILKFPPNNLKHPPNSFREFQCRNLKYARDIFNEIQCQNPFIWTSIIRSHALASQFNVSLSLYARMHHCGVLPSEFTLSSVLSACARIAAVREGRTTHSQIVKLGFCSNKIVQTVLLDMYSKCGDVGDARKVFDGMSERDIVSWTAMVSGYAKAGMMDPAREVFDVMPERNVVSWTSMVAGYASCGEVGNARELFDEMPERNSVSWTAMIAGYGKCGDIMSAREIFYQIPTKDPGAHAAMVACYSQNGFSEEAIELYKEMIEANVECNEVAAVAAISACTQIGDADMANMVAKQLEESNSELSLIAANALIHMHAKCGNMEKTFRIFENMRERDVISYSALITGLAEHGRAREALDIFATMLKEGVTPNKVTFVGVLNACSHAGMVDEGLNYFEMMKSHGVVPVTEHYACMVDLLGRKGRLTEAHRLIGSMVGQRDAGVWGALLAACRVHCNVELAEIAAAQLFVIEPENTGNYVLISNIYASLNRWDDAERVRKMMSERGMRKDAGYSWISS